jgi:TP901 family phage tail tape measure protein
MNVGSLMIIIGANTAGLSRAVRDVRILEKQVMSSTSVMSAALASFGRNLTQFVTIPMALVGAGAVAAFSEFEFNLAKITGLVGIAKDQTKAWGDELLDFAGKVGKGPKELSDALYYVTSSGFKSAEAMDILKISAQAAAVGLGETKDVADIVTSAMNAYGKANITAAQATDILVMTVREGKGEPADMIRAFSTVIPVAAKIGLSFDQVGAAMAAMTRLGTSSATSAVYLRQMLFTLLKPSQKTETALQKMKTSTQELRDSLRSEGLLPTLEKLKKLTAEYGETMMGNVFPNIRAFMGVIDLTGENLEENKKVFEALAKASGALDFAIASVSDTWKYQWNQTVAQGKVFLTQFGEVLARNLLPTLNNIKEGLANLGALFTELNPSVQNLIIKIGGAVLALGPFLLLLGSVRAMLVGMVPVINFVGKALVFLSNSVLAMSIPVKVAVLALTALSMILLSLEKHAKQAKAAELSLNKMRNESAKNVAQEVAELQKLNAVALNEYSTKAEKAAAIKRINELSPEYLGFINEETIRTGQAVQAMDLYVQSLQAKNELQLIGARLDEIQTRKIELLTNATAVRISRLEGLWVAIKAGVSPQTYEEKLMEKRVKMGNKLITVLENEKAALEKRNIQLKLTSFNSDVEAGYEDISRRLGDMQFSVEYVSKNKASVETLKADIEAQMKLIEDYTEFLAQQERERLMTDAKGAAMRRAIQKASTAEQRMLAQSVYDIWVHSVVSENKVINEELQRKLGYYNNFYNQLDLLVQKVSEIKIPKISDAEAAATKMENLWEDFATAMRSANNQVEVFEGSFDWTDSVEEKVKAIERVLKGISELPKIQFEAQMKTSKVQNLQEVYKIFKTYEDMQEIMKDVEKDQEDFWKSIENDMLNYVESLSELDTFEGVLTNLGLNLGYLTVQATNMGAAFDPVTAKLNLYEKALELLDGLVGFFTEDQKAMYAAIVKTTEGLKKQAESMDSLEKVTKKISEIDEKIRALGDSSEFLEEKLTLAQQKLRILIGAKDLENIDEWKNKVREAVFAVVELQMALEMKNLKNTAITSFFTNLGESIGNAAAGAEGAWDSLLMGLLDIVRQIGEVLIGLGALMMANPLTFGAGLTYALVGAAIVAFASYGSAALKKSSDTRSATREAPGFAMGGIVPPGYPNDSYPAMLTSGEAVIPAKKLPEFTKEKVDLNVTVQGVVRGSDLHYIIKEVDRKYKNSY